RLVRGARFDVARKAFALIQERAEDPAIKELVAGRLRQFDLIGKPAPPIAGADVDGKPVSLSDSKGEVVLVVFWASWCLPNAEEVAWFRRVFDAYRGRGLRVLGVNLD